MSTPRKKKPSRIGAQQTTKYSSVLGDHLRLVNQTNSDAKEKRSKYILAGGRRSSDRERAEISYRWDNLSPREQDVTVLVCRGYTNQQIARALNITVSSVKTYLRFVFSSMDVSDRVELRLKLKDYDFKDKNTYI